MKKTPMIKPAKAAENTERAKRTTEPASVFSNKRLYPVGDVMTSNSVEAAVKPRKWTASDRTMKFTIVAMKPTNVAVPLFLTHHTASIWAADPQITEERQMDRPEENR
jgi:hypothetical protein